MGTGVSKTTSVHNVAAGVSQSSFTVTQYSPVDGGMEIGPSHPAQDPLYGTVAIMAHAFLAAGGRRDPNNPPTLDPRSTRKHFDRYPVVF